MLVARNLQTNDPDANWQVRVVVRVTNSTGSSDVTIIFIFNSTQ